MKAVLDASAIIPALVGDHPKHSACSEWFAKGETGSVELAMSQHTVAEIYSALTGLRVGPTVVTQQINSLNMEVVELSRSHYFDAVSRLSAAGLPGGISYDMLHLIAAEHWGANVLVTANARDFERLPMSVAIQIVSL